jgi:hypothetical protein
MLYSLGKDVFVETVTGHANASVAPAASSPATWVRDEAPRPG